MSGRVQIICEKQGLNDTSSWSNRVLTVDVATRTLTVSRHHHPNNVLYHSIFVKEVQQWPHFTPAAIEDAFDSVQAKRTLCILGIEVPVPDFTLNALDQSEQGVCNPQEKPTSSTGSCPLQHTTQYGFIASGKHKKSRPVVSGGYEGWVIRFATQESYNVAVNTLKQMSDVVFNRKLDSEVLVTTAVIGAPCVLMPITPFFI